jgi:hypothetical protein
MKKILFTVSMCLGLALALGQVRADKPAKAQSCQWSDVAKLKEHLSKHVTYPAKGKAIKAACKKEMPDEFTKAERSCAEKKIVDATEYQSADDVLKALGVE